MYMTHTDTHPIFILLFIYLLLIYAMVLGVKVKTLAYKASTLELVIFPTV